MSDKLEKLIRIAEKQETVKNITYLINPTKNEIQGFVNRSLTGWLRGIVTTANNTIYIWDARLYDHNYVIKTLNLKEKTRFMVDKLGISTHTKNDFDEVNKTILKNLFDIRIL